MKNLVMAELYKARATRAIWAMVGIALASCVAWTVVQVLVFMADDRPEAVERSVESAYSMAQQGYVFVMILGIILIASEYRHRTVTWTFLATPKRGKVITAKLDHSCNHRLDSRPGCNPVDSTHRGTVAGGQGLSSVDI